MTCHACGRPLEPGRHPRAEYCLNRECVRTRQANAYKRFSAKKVEAKG